MKTVNLTCIGCPLGCSITVEMDGAEVKSVNGNSCQVGFNYAHKEMTNPTRIITSTVRVTGGDKAVVSVKTAQDVPKCRIMDCVRALKDVEVPAPVAIGQVIVPDIAGTGVAVIATRNILKV